MRKKYLIVGIVLLIIASIFGLKFVKGKTSEENIPDIKVYEAMLKCKVNPVKEIKMRIGANDYTIPLPEATAKVQDGIFITGASNLDKYLEETLPANGWEKCDNFGNVHVIKRSDGEGKLLFLAKPYSKAYLMLNFKSL